MPIPFHENNVNGIPFSGSSRVPGSSFISPVPGINKKVSQIGYTSPAQVSQTEPQQGGMIIFV